MEFSETDLRSHERGYPALLDISAGPAVGAVVFARTAVAGDIWLPDGTRTELSRLCVTGRPQLTLTPRPTRVPGAMKEHDRQARIFGDAGQEIIGRQKVGIVGLGGGGSLINEYLSRLGVGTSSSSIRTGYLVPTSRGSSEAAEATRASGLAASPILAG